MTEQSDHYVPTPHISAMPNDIAETVLMPGDPLRARSMTERYLEDAICFNDVRGMLGFTGRYKGKRISIMGSGMGMASIGIYSYELFAFYNVHNIIRVGTCGAFVEEFSVNSLLIAEAAYSESTYARIQTGFEGSVQKPSSMINEKILRTSEQLSLDVKKTLILSKDVYYNLIPDYYMNVMARTGAKATEMEAFALFANANATDKHAACILTVVDNLASGEKTSPLQREQGCLDMMKLSLETATML